MASDMIINSPEVVKVLEDYDFLFSSGVMMPVTIDFAAGDTIVFSTDMIKITLSAKPSLTDPSKILPAEDVTMFTKHLISIQHKTREIVPLSPEEKFAWEQTLKEMSKTVQ